MPRSVFIVDDNSAVRRSLVRLFTGAGFDVCGEARNGEEAIDIARRLNPGLIVMDISMPGISGIDAARSLRQLLPRVQIILLRVSLLAIAAVSIFVMLLANGVIK